MEKYKIKVGDRVRITRIDDLVYYGMAPYSVDDIGTIISQHQIGKGNTYVIEFDRLKQSYGRYQWCALEKWLAPETVLFKCE